MEHIERTTIILQIYTRLSSLEDSREEAIINDLPIEDFDIEIKALRFKLTDILNEVKSI